tara:strand:- start:622 stop:1173 length:552 start_codon:yes stop_codon:yes gene_type:complete
MKKSITPELRKVALSKIDEEISFLKNNDCENQELISGMQTVRHMIVHTEENKYFAQMLHDQYKKNHTALEEVFELFKHSLSQINNMEKVTLFCIEFNRTNIIEASETIQIIKENNLKPRIAYISREEAFADYKLIANKLFEKYDRFSLLVEPKDFSLSEITPYFSKSEIEKILDHQVEEQKCI